MSKWLFFLLLTAESFIFSQIKIEGKVFDKDTKTPMPYAFLINKNANYGAITNEDGYFTIICLPTDSLTVSFVGYQTQKVPVSYFTNHTIFYLKEKVNALNTVSVFGNVDMDMYLTLLMKAKRNLLATKPYKSKTYFTLESSANDIPIELLECYYNAELYHQGIKRLGLKNGRIGIAEIDQSYFVSLHTTHVLQNLKLSMKSNSDFPLSPLHFSPVRQKRLFDINLLSLNEDLFCLQFLAKGKLKELLNAKIWVDRKKGQIRKVELWKEDIGTHPFLEIDESHKMDSLCFRIAYTFDNSDRYMLNNIEFDYHFIYDNTVNSLPISSKGVFLFYEKEASFNLPKNAFSDLSTSDYDKIVSQPYNANFWKYNEVLTPSKKVIETRAFFADYGVLLNYSKLAPFNSLFKQSVRQWSKSRLRLADINNDQSYQLTPKKINFENQVIIKSELYEFTCGIYLDKNEINDSVFYTSATLINLDHSFYYLNPNHFSDCLLNIVFDLVEIERQRMSQDLTLKPWTFNQVDSIYAATSSRADFNVNQFIKETEHGNASLKMKNYIETIDMILGVDNLSIINTLDFEFSDTASNIDITEIYNAGTTLLQLGKFASALEVFKVGEAEGDKHPWLYYNIGICYYKLDQPNLACQFFQIAFELDEPIADIYSQLCFNYK